MLRAAASPVSLAAGRRAAAAVARPALSLARPAPVARRAVAARAASSGGEADVDKIVKDLQEKWDKTENKSGVVLYGAGAIVLVWLSSALVSSINAVPLLPKLMELVGLGYTAWFTYRYLLFKSSREELSKDVEEIKKRITGEM